MTNDWDVPSARAAELEADLGLPLDRHTRLRLLKRTVLKISWLFLHHQIDFNHQILNALHELTDKISQRIDEARIELGREVAERFDRGLRQAYREIGDHVARSQSDVTRLQQEIAALKCDVRRLQGGPRDPEMR